MPVATVPSLVAALRAYRLLDPERLDDVARRAGRFREPRELARELMQRDWLTAFQVNQLLQGKGADLVLGSYVLLERLGEGGMGQVFKARHQAMGRVVALKLLLKELMSRPDAVKRFHREIRLVAQLQHPNIVLAFDADQVAGVHFLAMEYVDGTDLGRLVKARGPLPVGDACDYIRQAALGLQHAHEHGMVHRDIKPTNLLRANQGGVVKLLDLGLARLQEDEDGPSGSDLQALAANGSTQLTYAGKVMGTPDYIAPEQARDSRAVDVRADLYSLGCTFFFLLTGFPPFRGGTGLEKLVRHQSEAPPPLDKLRPEVPPAVVAVVNRLMAKRPDQRFQTPGQLASALAALRNPAALPQAITAHPGGRRTGVVAAPVMAAAANLPTAVPVPAPAFGPGPRRRPRRARPVALLAWLGLGLFVVSGALFLAARLGAFDRKPRAEASAPAKDPTGPAWLCDLPEQDVSVARYEFGKRGDLGIDGRKIVVKGKESPHGLAIYPPAQGTARVTYALGRRFQRFRATAALNDRGPADGGPVTSPVIFRVYGDGNELWESRPLAQYGESAYCDIDVAGVERLQLVAECPGRRNLRTFAVWLEPQLLREAPGKGTGP